MGVVYKAHDTRLNRTVALKFLPAHVSASESDKKRFINEAQAASALDHPNICTIYSIEESVDGNIFIAMAHYEGESLNEKIEKGPLPLKDVISYATQIIEGLTAAHEKGIVHRDLKPANIFITNDDKVKIIDFGLAKAAQGTLVTQEGTTLGTAAYMSPEQAQGEKVDHRTDIWSFGVVIYEMITGQLPFKNEYSTALIYSIVNEHPEPVTGVRSGVPMDVERLINKCFEKEPADRYQQTNEILVDLRKVEKTLSSGVRSGITSQSTREFDTTASDDTKIVSGNRYGKRRMQPWIYGITVVLLLALILFFNMPDQSTAPELDNSIAVLPFENLSPDPDDAYFADGVHDDIIIQLSRIGGIRPIARSSVLRYGPDDRDLQQISDELNVSTILEGNVRRAGDAVRVSVQLIDPRTQRTLWADSYERNLTDLFEIQSDIAGEITSALKVSLTPDERERLDDRPTEIAEAYEYYMRGRDYFSRPGFMEENYKNAEILLKRAIEHDPEFAHAHALLSRTYSYLQWFGYDLSPEVARSSQRHAERALQLRSDLPEAHIAMGYYYYHGNRIYDEAMDHFAIARELQPNNPEVLSAIGAIERRLGRFEESIEKFADASILDPMNMLKKYNNSLTYLVLRRYEKVDSISETILSHSPDFRLARIHQSYNRIVWTGNTETAQDLIQNHSHTNIENTTNRWLILQFMIRDYEGIIRTANQLPGDVYRDHYYYMLPASYYLGLAYAYLNESEKAEQHYNSALSEMQDLSPIYRGVPIYHMGLGKIYAGLGLSDQAIEEGEMGVTLISPSTETTGSDAFASLIYKEYLAMIYAQLEKPAEAADILRELLSGPGWVSVPKLKIDPFWDPIRGTPEFEGLLREFEGNV